MSREKNTYIIPQAEVKFTKNQIKVLLKILDKSMDDKSDIIQYAESLFIKKKLEEADKMLR